MHEVGLMQHALDLALAAAERQEASRIHRITLRVGALAGVEAEALEFAFAVVTAGTAAAGAVFEIEQVPLICFCEGCQAEFQPPTPFFECPRCGQLSQQVRSGQELELVSLEVS